LALAARPGLRLLPLRAEALPLLLAPLEWPLPLRWLHEEEWAEAAPDGLLAGRTAALPLPAGRLPEAEREAAGRDSAPARLAGRLPEADCAGLRSRECVAGRLKWGRAADFPLANGLLAVGSVGSSGAVAAGSAFESGSLAVDSASSSPCSGSLS
jgi:hypothetical protein